MHYTFFLTCSGKLFENLTKWLLFKEMKNRRLVRSAYVHDEPLLPLLITLGWTIVIYLAPLSHLGNFMNKCRNYRITFNICNNLRLYIDYVIAGV